MKEHAIGGSVKPHTPTFSPFYRATSPARILSDLAVWRILLTLGQPFRRIIGLALLLGKSLFTLLEELQRWIFSGFGWLSAPPSSKALQHLGTSFINTRRWHFGAGAKLSFHLWPLPKILPACPTLRSLMCKIMIISQNDLRTLAISFLQQFKALVLVFVIRICTLQDLPYTTMFISLWIDTVLFILQN